MKYKEPKYEIMIAKAENIIAVSQDSYEIEQNSDGNGIITINALKLFK